MPEDSNSGEVPHIARKAGSDKRAKEGTEWALRDAYVGFKFRPHQGDVSDDYNNALQTDFPIIRVEEMYFIEAEAKAYAEGLASEYKL